MGYRFQKLRAWQNVYKETRNFLKEEIYGIRSQVRMSATSIPLNIAEDSIQLFYVALRSQLAEEIAEISRSIQALINSLEKKSNNQQPKTNNS